MEGDVTLRAYLQAVCPTAACPNPVGLCDAGCEDCQTEWPD